jgi:electron-transferring-flavoprotein dehydrogenase
VLYGEDGRVTGVATNDVGLDKKGKPKSNYERGLAMRAKLTLFAEGAHGSLTKQIIRQFGLRPPGQFQTYGLGLKEVRIEENCWGRSFLWQYQMFFR